LEGYFPLEFMPAIQPARLRQQAALLAESFDQPAAFIRSLTHLLEYYADRAHRPGQAGEPAPLVPAYNVRPPVLRQLIRELSVQAQEHPETTLILCDALWEKGILEFCLLSASLLGQIPPSASEAVMERIQRWLDSRLDYRLAQALLDTGLVRIRRARPDDLLVNIETWLDAEDTFTRKTALRALTPLAQDETFHNLPAIYRLVQPLCRTAPSPLRTDLLDLIEALARRSPRETAFFLKQTLDIPQSPDTPWLIRQILRSFPPEVESGLRLAVRKAGERYN
jgi:hypothetical protein